jgi:ribonuclease T2
VRVACRLATAVLALASAPAVQAQAWQCHVPGRIEAPAPVHPDGPSRSTPITGYALTLSWSPEFCRTRHGDPAQSTQCGGRIGRFGFILHGLWPDGADGDYPQWCPTTLSPSVDTVRRNLCMTPSAALLAHEWAKHGSCMARTPDAYFRSAQALYRSLHFPDMALLSRRPGLTAGDLRRALIATTPFLNPAMIRVNANRRGWLEDVHVCYAPSFMPMPCANRGAADDAPLKIWRSF